MRYRAFGVTVESELSWPGCVLAPDEPGPAVRLRVVPPPVLATAGGDELWRTELDGLTVRLRRDGDGSHMLEYGSAARFRIGPDRDELEVAAREPASPGWQRFLLDTGLLVLSHVRGFELLHGAGVEFAGRVVALVAPAGSGKTTLAAELVARGHGFVADDVLALDESPQGVVIHPGPPVMNLVAADTGSEAASRLPGSELARIGRDRWMSVAEHACRAPLPLGAVILLRRGGTGRGLRRQPVTVVDLLGHCVGFEENPERDRRRFDLVADVAATVPVFALDATLSETPAKLAAMVEEAVSDAGNVGASPEN